MNFVDPKAPYDASKAAGISFWAKRGENSTGKVRLKVPDVNTDPEGGVCKEPNNECFNDFGYDLNLTTDCKQYIFPWKSMRQMPGWGPAQAQDHAVAHLRPPVPGQRPQRQLRHLHRRRPVRLPVMNRSM